MDHMDSDTVVVGSGPNGLAAAIVLAQAGRSVAVLEASDTIGGGTRTAELTLPGYFHDVCSAIHPLGITSPFFRSLRLDNRGLSWVHPPSPLAHPLAGGTAVVLQRSVDDTAAGLGPDGDAYRRLLHPLVEGWESVEADFLGPPVAPRHPLAFARFLRHAAGSARSLVDRRFQGDRARALFAGLAAHAVIPLEMRPSAGFGLVLAILGHLTGWPFPRGGSGRLADALAAVLRDLGGEITTSRPVRSLADLPAGATTLLSITPRQLLEIAGEQLPPRYRRRLSRYRYGPGVFKMDWALGEPIPWRARECGLAGTVHVGGTFEEIAGTEREVWEGKAPERPFVLLAQQSLFDPTRAPQGRHTAWAYCHVPNGCPDDMTERIEGQIERFAPGFRDCILARSTLWPGDMEALNPNYVGGDITGGANILRQVISRPFLQRVPYSTPIPGVYLCSASTPPGGGVHGMCGYHAARAALKGLPPGPKSKTVDVSAW